MKDDNKAIKSTFEECIHYYSNLYGIAPTEAKSAESKCKRGPYAMRQSCFTISISVVLFKISISHCKVQTKLPSQSCSFQLPDVLI